MGTTVVGEVEVTPQGSPHPSFPHQDLHHHHIVTPQNPLCPLAMPRGVRTSPLGTQEVPGSPYRVRVLQVGYSIPQADGTCRADGSITLVWGGLVTALVDTGGPWDRQRLPQLLSEQGLSPGDITHVVCTHGHSDHAGNINLFPAATLLLGWDLSRADGLYLRHGLAAGQPVQLHPGLVEVVPTPGHTRSHVSLVVRGTAAGTVVVAGDVFERERDEGQWRALSEDPAEQERSRRRVLAMADVIVPGHGPPFRVLRDTGFLLVPEDGEGATNGDGSKQHENAPRGDGTFRSGPKEDEDGAGGGSML